MKKILSLIAILLPLLTSLSDCERNEPKTELEKLPPITQVGKNTFGCLVNEKAWVTKTSIDAVAVYQTGIFTLSASISNLIIKINLINPDIQSGEYAMNENSDSYCELHDTEIKGCSYATTSLHTGKLIITRFDKKNSIVSGTFSFTAFSDVCQESINVTEGRFDLTLIQ